MALYESKYGVITQPNATTYMVGNYQIVAKLELWELSPVPNPTTKTWLESASIFYTLEDALRVAIVFSKEDGLAVGIREMLYMITTQNKRTDSVQEGN